MNAPETVLPWKEFVDELSRQLSDFGKSAATYARLYSEQVEHYGGGEEVFKAKDEKLHHFLKGVTDAAKELSLEIDGLGDGNWLLRVSENNRHCAAIEKIRAAQKSLHILSEAHPEFSKYDDMFDGYALQQDLQRMLNALQSCEEFAAGQCRLADDIKSVGSLSV